jgi:hypothetical protein
MTVSVAQVMACTGDDSTGAATPDASSDSLVETGTGPGPADVTPADTYVPPTEAGCSVDASLNDAAVAEGKSLVLSYGCWNCHQVKPPSDGLTLEGRTTTLTVGKQIFPKNLTPDQATGIWCWTDDQYANAILNAIDDQGVQLCVMPQFAKRGMDAGSAYAISQFLRSLPAVSNTVPDSVCPSDAGADADAADGN